MPRGSYVVCSSCGSGFIPQGKRPSCPYCRARYSPPADQIASATSPFEDSLNVGTGPAASEAGRGRWANLPPSAKLDAPDYFGQTDPRELPPEARYTSAAKPPRDRSFDALGATIFFGLGLLVLYVSLVHYSVALAIIGSTLILLAALDAYWTSLWSRYEGLNPLQEFCVALPSRSIKLIAVVGAAGGC